MEIYPQNDKGIQDFRSFKSREDNNIDHSVSMKDISICGLSQTTERLNNDMSNNDSKRMIL